MLNLRANLQQVVTLSSSSSQLSENKVLRDFVVGAECQILELENLLGLSKIKCKQIISFFGEKEDAVVTQIFTCLSDFLLSFASAKKVILKNLNSSKVWDIYYGL